MTVPDPQPRLTKKVLEWKRRASKEAGEKRHALGLLQAEMLKLEAKVEQCQLIIADQRTFCRKANDDADDAERRLALALERGDQLADTAHLYVVNPSNATGEPLGRALGAWRELREGQK